MTDKSFSMSKLKTSACISSLPDSVLSDELTCKAGGCNFAWSFPHPGTWMDKVIWVVLAGKISSPSAFLFVVEMAALEVNLFIYFFFNSALAFFIIHGKRVAWLCLDSIPAYYRKSLFHPGIALPYSDCNLLMVFCVAPAPQQSHCSKLVEITEAKGICFFSQYLTQFLSSSIYKVSNVCISLPSQWTRSIWK